jgi:hypothetical protein
VKYLDKSFSVASGFGEGTKEKGRFVWDEAQKKLVRAEDYAPPSRALDGTIMVDRFYEGQRALDGTDIGSRRKYNDYLRARGLTNAGDFSPGYYERVRQEKASEEKRERRADVIEAYRRSHGR